MIVGEFASVELDDKELRKSVKNLIGLFDSKELMADLATLGFEDVFSNFQKEQSPDGRKWQPLSPAYLKRKTKRLGKSQITGRTANILQLTGRLRQSIAVSSTRSGSKDTYKKIKKGSAVIGTNVPYAAKHNFGDKAKGIPQREFMDISKRGREFMADVVAEEIKKSWRNV